MILYAVFLNYMSFLFDCIALVHFMFNKFLGFTCSNNFIKTNTKFVFNKTRINDSLCLEYKQHAIGF